MSDRLLGMSSQPIQQSFLDINDGGVVGFVVMRGRQWRRLLLRKIITTK